MEFLSLVKEKMKILHCRRTFCEGRSMMVSPAARKTHEIFQMAVLEPKLAILDETDSGLDIDALKVVSAGVTNCNARTTPSLSSPLSAALEFYHSRLCACAGRWTHRPLRGQGTRARARGKRLRLITRVNCNQRDESSRVHSSDLHGRFFNENPRIEVLK